MVSLAFHNVGGGILAVMMLLTAWDVILRYCLNKPVPGALELTEGILVVVVLFGMAYTALKKGNVRVDVLISRLPAKAQVVVESITSFVALGLFSLITWQAVVYANIRAAQGATTAILAVPISPFYLVVAAGSALLCLVLLRDLSSSLTQMAHGGWKFRQWLIPLLVLVLLVATALLWPQLLPAKIPPLTLGYLGLGVLILALFSGMPIGFVMALVAFLGMLYLRGIGHLPGGLAGQVRAP